VRAAVLDCGGPPDVLHLAEVADPSIQPDEVLVRVKAISLEGGDVLTRMRLPAQPSPKVIGYQAAGEVIRVGLGVHGVAVGQRISTFGFQGSHAELRAVPARYAFVAPKAMDFDLAAAAPVSFGTAHLALVTACELRQGETVLITGAAGGVGMAAVQIAKRVGARVIAAASSDTKLEALKALGADILINHRTTDLVEAVRNETNGAGVDAVMDPVGGQILCDALAVLAHRGRLALVGAAGRKGMNVDLSPVQFGAQTIRGVFLGPVLGSDDMRGVIADYMREISDGAYKVLIDRRFPLAEAAAAHTYYECREAIGRIILEP
jgi:NADPH2:quinone reductase